MTLNLFDPATDARTIVSQQMNKVLIEAGKRNFCHQELRNMIQVNMDQRQCIIESLSEKINLKYKNDIAVGFHIWKLMNRRDRFSVLQTFCNSFDAQLKVLNNQQQCMLFCEIFLVELIPVILQYLD